MPGSTRCARCGGLLTAIGETISVHPPRATALGKTLGVWRIRVFGRKMSRELISNSDSWYNTTETSNIKLSTLLRSIVPGWLLAFLGHPLPARVFLASYVLIALPGLIMLGTFAGAVLLGIAFAIHVMSVAKAFIPQQAVFRDRLVYTALCGILLAVLVYVPVGNILSRIAVPLAINQPLPPFAAGDVLWYRPTQTVRPGTFALYDSSEIRSALVAQNLVAQNHEVQLLINYGLRIDRVLATEGQVISWDRGKMLVDGSPAKASLSPCYEAIWPNFTVPFGHVLIDAAHLVPAGSNVDNRIWQQIALLSTAQVRGRVFFQSWPLSEVGFFD